MARLIRLLAPLCCLAVWLGLTVGPAAAVEVYPSYSPAVLRGSPPWTVTYRIELDSGPVAETVDFGELLPDASLEGPGTILDKRPMGVGGASRDWSGRCFLRDDSVWISPRVELPANSTSVLVFHQVISHALWLGADPLDYQFDVAEEAPDGSEHDVTIHAGGPQYAAARAFGLSLEARFTHNEGAPLKPQIPAGEVIPLVGETTPLLAGRTIDLRYTTAWPAVWHPLARVHVRPGGSFGWYRWQPTSPGIYTVKPFYRSHDGRFISESPPCGPTFQVLAGATAPPYDRGNG